MIEINDVLGWLFIAVAVITLFNNRPLLAMAWLILSKLCFIHADLKLK